MAGYGRLDRDPGGFLVADLADHHYIRILPEQIAQPVRESQSDIRVDIGLPDHLYLPFHRIFQCYEILFRGVEFIQDRKKGRGFAAAIGSGHENKAVRFFDDIIEDTDLLRRKTQLGVIPEKFLSLEHPDDDAFAHARGENRNPHVDKIVIAFLELEFYIAFLGPRLSRGFEASQDLYPGQNEFVKRQIALEYYP